MPAIRKPKTVTTLKAGRRLGVTSATIRRYIDQGTLRASRAASGRLYVTEASVNRLAKARGR